MFNIYYVHEFNDSINSKQLQTLQTKYENIECLVWETGNSLKKYIHDSITLIRKNSANNNRTNVIISNEVGSNLAIQMQFFLNQLGVGVSMVLLNPIFTTKQLHDTNKIPNEVLKYLLDCKKLSDTLIIIGESDMNINHRLIPKNIRKNNNIIELIENTNELEDLCECFEDIDLFIVSRFFNNNKFNPNK